MVKDLLSVLDFNRDDIEEIFRKADLLNKTPTEPELPLKGKSIGLIFSKASTRTRISFEVGVYQLGGNSLFLNYSDIQLGRGESLEDSAKIFSSYLDGIVIRTFSHNEVEELAKYSSIPIINGLTDLHHPCQIISDLYTINKRLKTLKGINIAYIGDGNNIVNSLIEGSALFGINLSIATPIGYEPSRPIVENGKLIAEKEGGSINLYNDPIKASKNADILYTDVWTSMGQEKENSIRKEIFKEFQINKEVLSYSKNSSLVMHCLPAHRGEEITSDVIDGERSIVFEQAKNRLNIQKSILELLINKTL